MFGKDRKESEDTSALESKAGKGRPTPKRKEAQAKNTRPLVLDKKAAKKAARARRNEAYQRQQEALDGTGDQRYLPAVDQGPVRRFARDYVDARWSIGEWFMPVIFLLLLVSLFFSRNQQLSLALLIGMWALFILGLLEVGFVTWRINRWVQAVPGALPGLKRGMFRYVLMRQITLRRIRRPRPQVARGQKPAIADYATEIQRFYKL